MAHDLSLILVIDVEATCWPPPSPSSLSTPGAPPSDPPREGEKQVSEIIEIGVSLVDVASLRILQNDDILVRPEQSKVSAYCTQLTTLTQAQVDAGISFADACRRLKKHYMAPERTWASWGDYDRTQFERQCKLSGTSYPFGRSHINIKNLFSIVHALPHELSMDAALEQAGMTLEGTHHRAGDDAKNIARLLIGVLGKCR